jgi:hypothetical protein
MAFVLALMLAALAFGSHAAYSEIGAGPTPNALRQVYQGTIVDVASGTARAAARAGCIAGPVRVRRWHDRPGVQHRVVRRLPPTKMRVPMTGDYPNVVYYCFNRVVAANCPS